MVNNKSKKYTHQELVEVLRLLASGASRRSIAEKLGRTVNSIKRLHCIFNQAKVLSGEEREEIFEKYKVSVELFGGALEAFLNDKEDKKQEEDLVGLGDKIDQARDNFEDALVDYAVAAGREIQRAKIGEVKKKYGKMVKRLEKRVSELEEVAEAAKKSNLSSTLRRRLLGYK